MWESHIIDHLDYQEDFAFEDALKLLNEFTDEEWEALKILCS